MGPPEPPPNPWKNGSPWLHENGSPLRVVFIWVFLYNIPMEVIKQNWVPLLGLFIMGLAGLGLIAYGIFCMIVDSDHYNKHS
jgi:phage shock protein PspC (stress-responsive transcriptional regulator)